MKPLGFTERGGTIKHIMWKLMRDGIDLAWRDVADTLTYMEKYGWIKYTGQIDAAGKVYDYIGNPNPLGDK